MNGRVDCRLQGEGGGVDGVAEQVRAAGRAPACRDAIQKDGWGTVGARADVGPVLGDALTWWSGRLPWRLRWRHAGSTRSSCVSRHPDQVIGLRGLIRTGPIPSDYGFKMGTTVVRAAPWFEGAELSRAGPWGRMVRLGRKPKRMAAGVAGAPSCTAAYLDTGATPERWGTMRRRCKVCCRAPAASPMWIWRVIPLPDYAAFRDYHHLTCEGSSGGGGALGTAARGTWGISP